MHSSAATEGSFKLNLKLSLDLPIYKMLFPYFRSPLPSLLTGRLVGGLLESDFCRLATDVPGPPLSIIIFIYPYIFIRFP